MADPEFWEGGPTLKNFEMSLRSRRGDAEGVAGEECERGLHWGATPQNFFKILGAFSCNLGIPQPYFQAYRHRTFPIGDWLTKEVLKDSLDWLFRWKGRLFAAGAVLMATLRAQCLTELWNRPKLRNTLGVVVGDPVSSLMLSLSEQWLAAIHAWLQPLGLPQQPVE